MLNNKPWLMKKDSEEIFVEVYGAKIYLKKLNYGSSRKALNTALTIDKLGNPHMDTGLLATLRTIAQIERWELTDEDDKELPITLDTFDNILDENFIEELMSKVTEKMGSQNGVSEEEKKQ